MYGDIIWTNVEPGQVYATTADAYYDGLVGEVVQAVGDTAAQSTFVFAEYDYWDGGMSALIPIVYYPHVVIAGHNQNTTGYLYCTVTDESTSWTMYVKTHDETFLQQVPRNGGKFRLMRHYEKDGVRTNETSSAVSLGREAPGSESGPWLNFFHVHHLDNSRFPNLIMRLLVKDVFGESVSLEHTFSLMIHRTYPTEIPMKMQLMCLLWIMPRCRQLMDATVDKTGRWLDMRKRHAPPFVAILTGT